MATSSLRLANSATAGAARASGAVYSVSQPSLAPCLADSDLAVNASQKLMDTFYARMPATLDGIVDSVAVIMPLLDVIPNVVFFIKDTHARYIAANMTLASRCGFKRVDQLIGKTSEEVFPPNLGKIYTAQDREVLDKVRIISDQLEMHLYGSREPGWCMTHKRPVLDRSGEVMGLVGISCDLQAARLSHPAYSRLAGVDVFIRKNLSRPILITELTALTGMSVSQLERYCKRVFHLTPRQMIHKVRLERATELLQSTRSITDIAAECGYTDHSAFSRQFKSLTGVSPSQFRASYPTSGQGQGQGQGLAQGGGSISEFAALHASEQIRDRASALESESRSTRF